MNHRLCSSLLLLMGGIASMAPALAKEHYAPDDHTMGALVLQRHGRGLEGASFDINTVSERGNLCNLDGTIRGQQAVLLDSAQQRCVVNFTPTGKGIRVQTKTPEACAGYCGHNAYFTGHYLKLPAACLDAAKKGSQRRFDALYRSQKYPQALNALKAMWQQCQPTMHWLEEMRVRNDLAITYAHLGDTDQCRKMLQPYRAEMMAADPQTERFVSYLFEDDYRVQLKNARFNWQKCQ